MRTCYDGHCVEYKESSESLPSAFTLFLVAGIIAIIFSAVTIILNDASLSTSLINSDYMNLIP